MPQLSRPINLLESLILSLFILPAQAINRTIGPPGDHHWSLVIQKCNGTNPDRFQFGTCSLLIDCVYEHLGEALKASLASGSGIAALLPTILVLIG